jgi:predicted RNA binding protein YcfA (HicA-like mRNA interferase family)
VKLPQVSWRDVVRALEKKGFEVKRQRGSHMVLEDDKGNVAVVPRHKVIKRGTLLSILKQAKLSRSEFLELLRDP